ncbi:MAG: hypothetical protein H7222_12365 [Methylotenera sp.]|nr:hypothetical protein [Oligoflexia bacterium]
MKRAPILSSILGLTLLFLAYCGYLISKPDSDVTFVRNVPSTLTPQALGKSVALLQDWPLWHHEMTSAELLDGRGQPYSRRDQMLNASSQGGLVLLKIENPQKQWKRFELTAKIVEYRPDQLIHLKLLRDSKNKITQLFDTLEWKIEFLPLDPADASPRNKGKDITLVRGTVIGHTDHWRGRLFCGLTPRIIMNQVLNADLVKLATVDQELALKAQAEPKAAEQTHN